MLFSFKSSSKSSSVKAYILAYSLSSAILPLAKESFKSLEIKSLLSSR